jgi:hypothetical protein
MATSFPAFHRADTARYLAILALILATIGFQLAAPDTDWARFVTIALEGAILALTLVVGHIHGALDRVLQAAVAIAVAISIVALAGFATLGEFDARLINLLVIGFAPIALLIGVVDDMRVRARVTVRTVIGVLNIYLLLGLVFAFVYGIVAAQSSSAFFQGDVTGEASDYLYFSYSTLTAVGYGDLVAALGAGRAIAILEALVGQLYLVTVVAVIVGNLGRLPSAPSHRPASRGRYSRS